MDKKSLHIGLNLGGWISQYPTYDHAHFQTFIQAADIARIAGWGFDHVRLPVDYPVLEDPDQAGNYRDSGFEYVTACLDWCQEHNLRVILDLHKAPGFAFDARGGNTLFENAALQTRFLDLWETIAQRLAAYSDDFLAFEFLNEIVIPESTPWNTLFAKTLARVREYSPQRLVVVGGNYFNAASELQNLVLPPDPNLLCTFHFYNPLVVTHQRAPWVPLLREHNRAVDYPGTEDGHLAQVAERFRREVLTQPGFNDPALAGHIAELATESGQHFDQDYLKAHLAAALEFSQATGQPLYCGEFGVYEAAPMSVRLNWTRDFVELLNQFDIGRAYWTYKALDFGLVDAEGNVVNQELVEIASQR